MASATDGDSSLHGEFDDDAGEFGILPEFPLGPRPTIGPEAPVNPFHESSNWSVFQVTKSLLLLPLLIVRVVTLATLMAVGYVFIKLALIGVSDPLFKPFSPWRRFLLWPVRLGARALLFTMGYYYIHIKGKPAHRSVAPILVSNHIGFVDPIFVFYYHLPILVAAKENVEMPIVGMFLQALQVCHLQVLFFFFFFWGSKLKLTLFLKMGPLFSSDGNVDSADYTGGSSIS
jgi:hypothetical protein